MRSFQPQDTELLIRRVKAVPANWDNTTNWHRLHLRVLDMVTPPAALLLHIYETCYCSCCRCNALEALDKLDLLTDAIRAECRFDSNDDIRSK